MLALTRTGRDATARTLAPCRPRFVGWQQLACRGAQAKAGEFCPAQRWTNTTTAPHLSLAAMLYVDKHRPTSFQQLTYHPELTERLQGLSRVADLPHTLFYGPPGAGKRTRINCLLRDLFGPGAQKVRVTQRIFLTPSKRKIDINIITSNHHIELTPRYVYQPNPNPPSRSEASTARAKRAVVLPHALANFFLSTSSDAGNYDRLVVQDVIKDIAKTAVLEGGPVEPGNLSGHTPTATAKGKFKVVVIYSADQLTRDAQAALRRTMEKYMSNLRLILCADSLARLIAPIRSRCLLLRVPAPSESDLLNVLDAVAKKEKFGLPPASAQSITRNSQGNTRRAVLMLELYHQHGGAADTGSKEGKKALDAAIALPDWEQVARSAADVALTKLTSEGVLEVRAMLYALLTHAIPATTILKTVSFRMTQRIPASEENDELRSAVIAWAAVYQSRLRQGAKPILHLEAFVVKIMSVYKTKQMGGPVERPEL